MTIISYPGESHSQPNSQFNLNPAVHNLFIYVYVNNIILLRLVIGLMDRLERKLGREGLRTRVRVVDSSQAQARGKENLARSPRLNQEAAVSKRISLLVSSRSPLRTNPPPDSEAEVIPPAAGKQL